MTDPMPSFGDATVAAQTLLQHREIASLTIPQVTGGDEPLTYTLEVSLPSPDLDDDGNVNFADFLTFASKFGSQLGQERYDARCDLIGDGQIDFDDFLIFADSFGLTG